MESCQKGRQSIKVRVETTIHPAQTKLEDTQLSLWSRVNNATKMITHQNHFTDLVTPQRSQS